MKKVLFLFILLFNTIIYAHESPIAFAEMELNKDSQLELTVTIESNVIQQYLEKGGYLVTDFENHLNRDAISTYLKRYISSGFKVWEAEKFIGFEFVDYQIKNNGTIEFYFLSVKVQHNKPFKVKFDLMMQDHDHQQNKLIYIVGKNEKTYVFTNQLQEILIENEIK